MVCSWEGHVSLLRFRWLSEDATAVSLKIDRNLSTTRDSTTNSDENSNGNSETLDVEAALAYREPDHDPEKRNPECQTPSCHYQINTRRVMTDTGVITLCQRCMKNHIVEGTS